MNEMFQFFKNWNKNAQHIAKNHIVFVALS